MPLPFRLYLDDELNVMHVQQDCPAAKVAVKYRYLKSEYVETKERALVLDARYRACDLCQQKLEARRGPVVPAPSRHYRYKRRSK